MFRGLEQLKSHKHVNNGEYSGGENRCADECQEACIIVRSDALIVVIVCDDRILYDLPPMLHLLICIVESIECI